MEQQPKPPAPAAGPSPSAGSGPTGGNRPIERRPAYSAAFVRDALKTLVPFSPLEQITRDWAWGGSTGKGVKVAVIDSGIDAAHPAIDGRVSGYVEVDEGKDGAILYKTEPHDDAYGHGTACAGIIRAVAPECELYSVKVLGSALFGRGVIFAAGLRWALDNGMHVCNLSLGTTKKDFFGVLHELSDDAYFKNVMLITAANNMPIPSFPGIYASVISVASHEVCDPYLYYYNPTPPVEFGAPGINVRVAWMNQQYITATGNSFAAPHLSGLVTKILGKHPGLTSFQMKVILRALAANVTPYTTEKEKGETGNEEEKVP
jgi:subtilisin family serine protease